MPRQADRFAAFSCPHAPFTDPDAADWFESALKDHKPQVLVCLGDLYEADAAARWDKDKKKTATLHQEYVAAADLLKRFRAASRAKVLVWCEGNHDDNVRRTGRLDEDIRDSCLPENHARLGPERERWRVVPYEMSMRGIWWLGPVGFKHGFSSGRGADETEAVYFARSRPGSLVVGGHTHRPLQPSQCHWSERLPLPIWYANAGTLGPLKPHYAARQNTDQWAHAGVVGSVAGKTWQAQTIWKP